MATINGISIRSTKSIKNDDSTTSYFGSLYLCGQKIASFLQENVSGMEPATQLFMMHGFSEEKLMAQITEVNAGRAGVRPDGTEVDYTLDNLVAEYKWLKELESEFNRHIGTSTGGMIAMQFQQAKLNLGIPQRYAEATDEEILEALESTIEQKQQYYGPLLGYLIFHHPSEFDQGTQITLDSIRI